LESFEGDGHVDGVGGLAVDGELGEDVARGLVNDGRLLVAADGGDIGCGVPGGFGDEFACGGAAFGRDDAVVVDGAVAGACVGLDGVGVVPVVDVVDVGVVEPEAGVVGMVGALAGQGRIAAGERGAVGSKQRVEDGLALVGLPEIGGEGAPSMVMSTRWADSLVVTVTPCAGFCARVDVGSMRITPKRTSNSKNKYGDSSLRSE
jgi:hypothetical protein